MKLISEIIIGIRVNIDALEISQGKAPDSACLSPHQHHRIEGKNAQCGLGRTLSHQNLVKECKGHCHENPNDSSGACWLERPLCMSVVISFPVLQSQERSELRKT